MNLSITFKQINDKYILLAKNIENAYTILSKNPNFNLKKADILTSFDNFVESVIIKIILTTRPLVIDDLLFIHNLGKYTDYFKEYNLTSEKEINNELCNSLLNKCNSNLENIPAFMVMAVMIDKELENSLDKTSDSFSSTIYESLKALVAPLISTDDKKKQLELERITINNIFNEICLFLKENHVICI